MEPARILMALILLSSVLVAQSADEQTTKTPRSDSSTLAPLMRPKRVIVFRPLFVYRQQEVRKQRIRDEPKSASYGGDSYYSQRPSSSSASSYYNNQLQPYQPYYPAYWPPTSSASSYWPPAPAVNPYYPSYPSYPSSGSAYYRPATTTTTRRPRTTTEKFRPYPFWG